MSEAHLGIAKGPHSKETKRKMSETHKALWADLEYKERMVRLLLGAQGRKPSEPEELLLLCLKKNFPDEWLYNGMGNEHISIGGRIPDFVRADKQRYVVEMFGSIYHHSLDAQIRGSEEETIKHYKKFGYKCLVIWGDETLDEEYVISRVKEIKNSLGVR